MATKGERTRDHILGEASRLIQRKGIGATSIGEILSAAGVHKGSLYFHFQDKEEIGCEVIRQAADRFLGFVDRSLTGATPGEALDNFFSAALAFHSGSRIRRRMPVREHGVGNQRRRTPAGRLGK
jgi:TetR/AcrR family transcriptional repressor of nem operon